MGPAFANLAFVTRRRGHNDAALEFLHDAVALYRDLDVPLMLSGLLVDLAAQLADMGQGAQALHALAESSQLDMQVGRLPGRSFRLAIASVAHLARGQPAMATSALGAYDAHPVETAGWGRPIGGGGSIGLLADVVELTRAQLDPIELAATTAAARRKSLDELIDELIIQPANAAAVASGPTTGPADDR